MKQNVAVRMTRRVSQSLVANTAAIDEPVLQVGLTAIKRWQSYPA